MRILHTVESYYPAVNGMAEVVKQLSERLVQMGHSVTVAARKDANRKDFIVNGVEIKEFDVTGNYTIGLKGDVESYKSFLLNSDFDIITNFAAQQWATDVALPILKNIRGKKVNVPTGFSGFYSDNYKAYYEYMKAWMKDYDANVFLSDNYRDINFARENGITKNFLITNGADEREFASTEVKTDIRKLFGLKPDCFLVLHVGSYSGAKGHKEAIEIFLRSSIKNGALLMIGNNLDYFKKRSIFKYYKTGLLWLSKMLSSKKVILTSAERNITVDAYKQADAFLFPSQIECSPIVLFEAMAAGIPFLTTDVGNSAEIAKWSGGGIILPTRTDSLHYSHAEIHGSVKELDTLYENKALAKKLSESGRRSWEAKFTWATIAKQYEELYKSLLIGKV